MYRSFEDLVVWQRACALAVYTYEALDDVRQFGLKDPMPRAAVSIASNIAEGSERSPRNFARFLSMARGSAAELRTQAYIAERVGIISDQAMRAIVDETKQLARMLFALASSLKADKESATRSKLKTENRKLNTEH